MSASVMHSAPIYAAFGRMHSVEELDSSLTLLSRHNILPKPLPITPPGTPIAQSPEESFEYSPESPSATIPPNTPVTPAGNLGPLRVNTCGGSAEQKLPNIDNKIEQAMDLVKTHLTFAVREEIEVLRQTIHELEQKVSNIEQENQLLRQFAPPHIVADLPQMLALQRQTNAQAAASRAPTMSAVPAPTSAPKIAPEGFCSTSFANTLNNVVADVRQQIRSIPPAPRDPQ